MYIIAGLGNPGREYEGTRHNIGFEVIDRLAETEKISVLEAKHKALLGKGYIGGEKVILVKPQTYMNLSGTSIREIADYFKVDTTTNLIVISDDISLAPGQIRVRKKGSAGGHNGLKNIIEQLGTENFARVKMGVGAKPAEMDLAKYVLGHFGGEDKKAMSEAVDTAVLAIKMMMTDGPDAAMNRFNAKK